MNDRTILFSMNILKNMNCLVERIGRKQVSISAIL